MSKNCWYKWFYALFQGQDVWVREERIPGQTSNSKERKNETANERETETAKKGEAIIGCELFFWFLNKKTHVVGTQKNNLFEPPKHMFRVIG